LARKNQSDQSHVFGRTKEQKLFGFVKQNKLKPREVVSVGDTEEEIQIGKQYGYHTVAITGGYNTTARLKKQKPDFLIHNMLELKKIVKQLNKY
jgi:phosphoglycolate phosphatase-like HAD superfamily hydrolase